ncbi:amino acid adenylation domain-containing protein [Streptomyces sp. NBC_01618]|uniref:amino acid adenylation domain-containing protein n=1 Tax=Streptomyces sp. NBC_01618 TaxID=2975900 RepID=UPI0038632D33|nr:amino acid adenylation domain-containing protein [Streptomyces sp. NBC_01618]
MTEWSVALDPGLHAALDAVPVPTAELVQAVAAVALHYTAYGEPVRFGFAACDGRAPLEVAADVDPDEPFAALAARIARSAGTGADGPVDGPSGNLVVLGSGSGIDGGTVRRLTLDLTEGRLNATSAPGVDVEPGVFPKVFLTLLRQAADDPERTVGSCELLAEDADRVLRAFNATDREFPDDVTLHGIFREQARSHPDRVAVSTDGERLTYRELDERTDRLAGALRERVAPAGGIVAVLAERSLDLPVALLGILKAGCAYLPLDPQSPPRRLAETLERSGAVTVLAQRPLVGLVEGAPVEVLALDDPLLYEPAAVTEECAGPRDLAYVLYTSGSTGLPKGVMVEHRSVVNRLAWMQRNHPLGPEDTLLQKTPVIFDVSVWELFWWMFTGARMHLLAPGMERFPLAIVEAVERERVTAVHFVPSMLNVFVDHVAAAGAAGSLSSLRWVFSSGESLPASVADACDKTFGGPAGPRLVNLYGPTETTVDVTAHTCASGPASGRIPIGRPIDNTRLYVLRHGRPMPVGLFGTLHVGGVPVARGYLGDERLTEERFVPEYGRPTERMYDTGDIVRWLPSGDIDFLGRNDLQIKLRGIRIDLQEIEDVLLEAPGVVECAVRLETPGPSLSLLRGAVAGGPDLSAPVLRAHLGERLPPYMIPSTFDRFEGLPRTASGKIDRRSLADPSVREQGVRL